MSVYYTPPPIVIDGDIAYAKDVNDINNETDAGFAAVEADFTGLTGIVQAWAELAEKWAQNPEDVEVEPGAYSALHWSAKSDGFAQDSAASALAAFNSETAAALSAANALTSETNAATSASASATSAGESAASAVESADSATESGVARDKAEQWAQEAEDVPVEPGEYSAYHWAQKASEVGGDSVKSVTGTTDRIDVDNTDPLNPIVDISPSFVSGGQVDSIVGTTDEIDVDNTDPVNPIISISPNFGGGGGGLEWQAVQIADVTAESGKGYPVDTTLVERTLTLPLSPVLNDQVGYKDAEGQFGNYPLTIDPNGELIEGLNTFYVNSRGAGGTLVYSGDATIGWLLVAAAPMETVQTKPLLHIQDQKPTGTDGGSSLSSNLGNDRVLNTVLTNEIAGASLSSNLVTLPAGTYYAEAISSAYVSTAASFFSKLEKADGTLLLRGNNEHGYAGQGVTVDGEFTLTETTQVKVNTVQGGAVATVGLGVALGVPPYEVYTDLRIWQLDTVVTTPVLINDKLYPLPGNTLVTGNMHGLEYAKSADNGVTVQAGICMDSTNQVILSAATSQVVTIGSVINEVYNLFLCDDGVVRTDTDVNGSALSAYDFRWIGFVPTNGSGVISDFAMSADMFSFLKTNEAALTSGVFTRQAVDLSLRVPPSRVRSVQFGASAGTIADNQQTFYVFHGDSTAAFARILGNSAYMGSFLDWENSGQSSASMANVEGTLTAAGFQASCSSANLQLAIHFVKMKR